MTTAPTFGPTSIIYIYENVTGDPPINPANLITRIALDSLIAAGIAIFLIILTIVERSSFTIQSPEGGTGAGYSGKGGDSDHGLLDPLNLDKEIMVEMSTTTPSGKARRKTLAKKSDAHHSKHQYRPDGGGEGDEDHHDDDGGHRHRGASQHRGKASDPADLL